MKRSFLTVASLLCCVMTFTACSGSVASVNGKKIDSRIFGARLRERAEEVKRQGIADDQRNLKESLLQEMVNERLSLDEAATRNIAVSDDEVRRDLESLTQRIGAEALAAKLKSLQITPEQHRQMIGERLLLGKFIGTFAAENAVSDDEAQEYYRSSQTPFLRPAQVLMKIADFSSEVAARKAAQELRKSGQDFDAAMQKLAQTGEVMVSGYGWVSPDGFSPVLAAALKGLKEGQFGGPYKGQRGFFLVRVSERKPEGVSSFDEARETIKSALLQQKRISAYQQWLQGRRESARITISLDR